MTFPMPWLVATFVILQFSFGVGRNTETPEDIQHLNDVKKLGDMSMDFDDFPRDFDDFSKDFDDMTRDFETRRRKMETDRNIAIGCIFGVIGFCLLIFLCIFFCCPEKLKRRGRILVVATPVEVHNPQAVGTAHYPPPPPSYDDSMQQFPSQQYHPPPAAGQQIQYPAAQNPGFRY